MCTSPKLPFLDSETMCESLLRHVDCIDAVSLRSFLAHDVLTQQLQQSPFLVQSLAVQQSSRAAESLFSLHSRVQGASWHFCARACRRDTGETCAGASLRRMFWRPPGRRRMCHWQARLVKKPLAASRPSLPFLMLYDDFNMLDNLVPTCT